MHSSSNNKQSGFAIIEMVLLAIVIVSMLGVIGWTLYNTHNQTTKKTADATTNSTNTSQSPPKENTTATTTPQITYLTINEFGIKIPLDSSIADTTYTYDPSENTNPTEAQIVSVTTKSLASASNNKCNLFQITKTADQNLLGTPLAPNNTNTFKIGNDYYVLNGIQFVCSTDNSVQQLLYKQSNTFAQDFKAAQPNTAQPAN